MQRAIQISLVREMVHHLASSAWTAKSLSCRVVAVDLRAVSYAFETPALSKLCVMLSSQTVRRCRAIHDITAGKRPL